MSEQQRTPLQEFVIEAGIKAGVEPVIFEASDHSYWCKCEKCLAWWVKLGPDPDTNKHGPFTQDEIDEYLSGEM